LYCFCILGAIFGYHEDAVAVAADSRLYSRDWRLRKVAFSQIKGDKSSEARKELINLLDREESIMRQAYREGVGIENRYGEGYVAYTDNLTSVVADNFKQTHDRAALRVLLHAAYNPDSAFARWLGEQGPDILPYTSEMQNSDSFPERETPITVVAHMIAAAQK